MHNEKIIANRATIIKTTTATTTTTTTKLGNKETPLSKNGGHSPKHKCV